VSYPLPEIHVHGRVATASVHREKGKRRETHVVYSD
jgi:hypothetical protein